MESPISKTEHGDQIIENNKIGYTKGILNSISTENDTEITKEKSFTSITTIEITETNSDDKEYADTDDLVILRKDPTTKRNFINKSAYAKLHRTLSPSRNSTLKEKYEPNTKPDLIDVKSDTNEDNDTTQIPKSKRTSPAKLDEETVQSLKNKYSPASFGYPRTVSRNSKLPIPKPRSAIKSQIILPSNKQPESSKLRYSLDVDKKPNSKDENSNELYRKNSSSSGEFISIITRSDSEGSVDKLERELNLFTMDGKPKEKKRSNSFRKIFSGKIFGKDKKKKEEEKNKLQYKENVANTENLQNETNAFSRQTTYRHTTGGSSSIKSKENNITKSDDEKSLQQKQNITKELEDRYAQMYVSQFNHIKQGFENPNSDPANQPTDYVLMDKPIAKNNPGPTNYMNMPNVKKYIDTSSSASTLESDMSNIYKNDIFTTINNEQNFRDERESKNDNLGTFRSIRFGETRDNSRDTPPRAQELRQDVRLVNPKALIPINTERSLPNPYQNNETLPVGKPLISPKPTLTDKAERQPYFEETYGTVLDSIEYSQGRSRAVQRVPSKTSDLRGSQKPPRSPSFEPTKLKLPQNREIIPLSPRVKSPIPHDNVSTEKIIATELLKPTKSPTPARKSNTILSSPSHQKLEIDIDYPDNINNERSENSFENNTTLSSKPPISKMSSGRSPEASTSSANSLTRQGINRHSPAFDSKRLSQVSPASGDLDQIYSKYRRSQASPVAENQEKITTNAMVHVNSYNTRTPTPNSLLHNRSLSPMRPQSARSSTPVDLRISPSSKSSPQKDDMRKSVEAYYWKEIKKLKEQENFDIYLYQMQMMPYGYAEDPISIRRSRSLSPTSHRNSRRSLSLPRDPRPNTVKEIPENSYGRIPPASIPEGRAVVNHQLPQRNITYGQLQSYQSNFRRNTPERRTIEGTPRNYENYSNNIYRPIFKRGSLTTPVRELTEDLQNKKVSFSSSREDTQSLQSWPTKNGFTQSPPQRRIENNRNSALEDDVFLQNLPRNQNTYGGSEIYGYANKVPNVQYNYGPNTNDNIYYGSRQYLAQHNQEPLYGPNPNVRYRQIKTVEYGPQEESLYGRPLDAVNSPYGLTRHGSIQIQEPLYGQRQSASRRMSYDNTSLNSTGQRSIPEPHYVNRQQVPPQNRVDPRYGYKREIIMKDEIFGQFGGYIPQNSNEERYLQNKQPQNPMHSSRQSVAEPIYGRGGPKQISVRNKVCDIYGQIHDRDSPSLISPSQIRKSGVILGQLQSNPGSPQVVRQSYSHLSNEQFARNTRLTASANDMYRRYPNTDPRYRSDVVYGGARYPYQDVGAPTRPLPPVPKDKKVLSRNNPGKSDTESATNASETQKVLNSSAKNKKRSFFGK